MSEHDHRRGDGREEGGIPDRIPTVLVLPLLPEQRELEAEREEEMRSLLDTAGCEVVGVARQHLRRPVRSTWIGKGKIDEIWSLVEETGALEVAFSVDLAPSQHRNLESRLEITVIDYTALILHIFARNARTHQAMLAVELAQLEYNRSRLKRMWTHLDRIKAGTNMRGPGEKQLESDRRLVDQRIQELKKKLAQIEDRKERAISARDDCVKVALVGYTNAGKSSLMNALTEADALTRDALFATLDTRTARLELDRQHHLVISDTVGFIRDLPHTLVASFHATLAEVIEADLLLHVVDASQPTMERQIAAVEDVLRQIEADAIPSIMVFNKVDIAHSRTLTLAFKRHYKRSVLVSAHTGEGLDRLREEILAFVTANLRRYRVSFPAADGATNAFLHRRAVILDQEFTDDECRLTIEADARLADELEENEKCRVERLQGPVNK